MKLADKLRELDACAAAIKWVGNRDLATAWQECQRGDWMLWYMDKRNVDRRVLVLGACACAETAYRYLPADDDRPRRAVQTARAWCRGEATIGEVASATADAFRASDAYANQSIISLRTYATSAAYAISTIRGGNYACAASLAAAGALTDRPRSHALARMADIVRRVVREWDERGGKP